MPLCGRARVCEVGGKRARLSRARFFLLFIFHSSYVQRTTIVILLYRYIVCVFTILLLLCNGLLPHARPLRSSDNRADGVGTCASAYRTAFYQAAKLVGGSTCVTIWMCVRCQSNKPPPPSPATATTAPAMRPRRFVTRESIRK